jgi:hypothetical protein
MYNFSFMRKRRRAGVGVVITDFGSCSSGMMTVDFFRRTKGELPRSTKVFILVVLALAGQGGTAMTEALLWRDPIVLILREMESRLDELEAVNEFRSIADMEPIDEVGVTVPEFRIVSEADELTELPVVSESPEKLAIESRVPGDAEKKDDRDELDMWLKRAVLS